jgi:hypothetical protein
MTKILAILLGFLLSVTVAATEVDDTLTYYDSIADSEAILNAQVQEQIERARADFFGCDLNIFARRASRYLTGNLFYGAIESDANHSQLVDKRNLAIRDSLYAGTPFEYSIVGRLFNMASTINVAGHKIGTDKLGHFFDMGFEFFNLHKNGADLTALLERSASEQQGIWGLYTTGVKSFGDMTANIDGFRFWQDMLGEGEHPYFVCENGSLKQIRAFLWSDYVSAGWTESINCSAYSSDDYQIQIDRNLSLAETRDGRRYHCPIEPQLCAPLRAYYAQWFTPAQSDRFISSLCK